MVSFPTPFDPMTAGPPTVAEVSYERQYVPALSEGRGRDGPRAADETNILTELENFDNVKETSVPGCEEL